MSSYDPSGIICTPEDRAIELAAQANHTFASLQCLTRGQSSIGLTITVEAGLASGIAVLVVFALIIRNKMQYPRERLIKGPMDLYMLLLFTADFVQAAGATMNIKWIKDGKVQAGGFCTAQGAIKELGETTVAITTLVITFQTFFVVWRGSKTTHPMRWAYLIVTCVLLFVTLYISIAASTVKRNSGGLYGPTGYWCWIREDHLAFIITGEYMWLWLTLFFSLVLYIPLAFLFLRPSEATNTQRRRRFNIFWQADTNDPEAEQRRRTALSMIAYPVVYSVLIIQLSVVRFIEFTNKPSFVIVSSAATLSAITIFGLFGLFNVLLFVITRPDLLLFDKRKLGLNEVHLPQPPEEIPEADGDRTREEESPTQNGASDWDGANDGDPERR